MPTRSDLERAVSSAFARIAGDLPHWPDPHPDGASPLDVEYSRLLDPAKWRIVPARAEAWCEAAVKVGIATLERDIPVRWAKKSRVPHRRIDRLVPHVPGALPLVLAYTAFGGEALNGVEVATGDPAVVVGLSPDCGCDACDSGSENELIHLDEQLRMVVLGQVRHLSAGDRRIVSFPNGWHVTGALGRREVEEVLANPVGWKEVSGNSWIEG